MPTLLQLYSARNLPSLDGLLDTVAAAGYDGVEGCWLNFDEAEVLRAELDARGLTMPQAHFPLNMLEQEFDRAVNLCGALGIHTLVAPWLPEADRPTTSDGWRAFGLRLHLIEGKLRALGLRFAWHNHDFELVELPEGGTPLEILLRTAPGMDWEADIGWILRIGQDPVRWLKTHAGRVVAVHIKDVQPDPNNAPEDGWEDLGHGTTDWLPIFKALKSLPRLAAHIAEHDHPADFYRFMSRWKIAFDRLRAVQSECEFEGFTHVAMKVMDINKQLAFYSSVMGFKEMFRLNSDDGSLFLVYLRINDRQYLELFPNACGEEVPTPDARGYQHICLDVVDLDATVDALRARGARMCLWRVDLTGIYEVEGSAITMGKDGNRQSWLMDPEGNRIELMELALSGFQYEEMASRLLKI